PTRDDCTRHAVARLTGRPLRRRPEAMESMRRRLAEWGRTPTGPQLRQALIPSGAEVLVNPVGSAPGFCLSWRGCLVVALPGVPLGQSVYAEGKGTMEEVVGRHLAAHHLTLAVAESCTGGLVGHRLTQVSGSSAYLDRVAVCYSVRAKVDLLGIPEALIRRHGAVSAEVAEAMARGIRSRSQAGVGLSVTGIAGPTGGTAQKPVGLVFVGLDAPGRRTTREFRFHGDRHSIKLRASQAALEMLRQWLVTTGSRGR